MVERKKKQLKGPLDVGLNEIKKKSKSKTEEEAKNLEGKHEAELLQ
jgi:hypothetical protein